MNETLNKIDISTTEAKKQDINENKVSQSIDKILSPKDSEIRDSERIKSLNEDPRKLELDKFKEDKKWEIISDTKEASLESSKDFISQSEIISYFNSDELKASLSEDAEMYEADLDLQLRLLKELIISRDDFSDIFNEVSLLLNNGDEDFIFDFLNWDVDNEYLISLVIEYWSNDDEIKEKWEIRKNELIEEFYNKTSDKEKQTISKYSSEAKTFAIQSIMKAEELNKEDAIAKYSEWGDEYQKAYEVQYIMYNKHARADFESSMSDERKEEFKAKFNEIDSLNKQIYWDDYQDFIWTALKIVKVGDVTIDKVTKSFPVISLEWKNDTEIVVSSKDDPDVINMKKQSRPAKNSIVQLERERNIILRNLGKLESQLKDVLEMIDNDKNDNKLSSSEKKEVYAKKEHLENLIEESIQKIKIIDIQIKEYEKDIKKIEDNYIESVGEKVDVARENMRILDYLGFTNLNQNKLNEVLAQVSVWTLNTHIQPWNGGTIDFTKKDFWIWSLVDDTYALKSIIRLFNKMVSGNQNEPNDVSKTFGKITQKAYEQSAFEWLNRSNLIMLKENGILSQDGQKTYQEKMITNLSKNPNKEENITK